MIQRPCRSHKYINVCKKIKKHYYIFQVEFYEVTGEPYGARSFDITWEFSKTFYECCLGLAYNLCTCLAAPWVAGWWGCQFAFVAFKNVWFFAPCLKIMEISCSVFSRIFRSCIRCCIYPPCRSLGHFFIAFRTEGVNDAEDDDPFYHLPPAPVRKTRIIQTPSRNNKVTPEKMDPGKGSQPSNTKKGKGEDPKVVPGVVVIGSVPDKEDDAEYIGDRGNMVNAIKRQMMM